VTSFWWGRGVPWGARLRARSINPRMEGLQPWPNRWGPYFVQCSRLREAHRAHPRSQTGQRTSSQGACFEGSEFSKVVASMLFHFFGTLMRDFELQHSGHPRFSASPAAAVVQQMGHYDSLRRVQSRRSRPRAVGRGRRLFCVRHHPPRVHRRVERCALALEPAPAAHTVPVLTACARRARAQAGC
jgi:hypothetical protein